MSSVDTKNNMTANDVPGGDPVDNDYKSRTGQHHIPVQGDEAPVSDPIDPATADSDETLGMPFFPYPRFSVFFLRRMY